MTFRRVSGGMLAAALFVLFGSARCTPILDLGTNDGDAEVDATPSRCNVDDGTCRAGEGCDPDSCRHCVCDADHHWYCSVTCDGGTDCPSTRPSEHSPCKATSSEAPACTYDSGCHDPDVALCANGQWELYAGGGCPPPLHCPPMAPPNGLPCGERVSCHWKNPCGVAVVATCDGHSWSVSNPPCTPGACPPSTPTEHTTCPSDGLKCEWSNGCGTHDYGICTSGGWSVKSSCSSLQCPAITPAAGDPCMLEESSCAWAAGCEAGAYLQATCSRGIWVFAAGCS